MCMCASVILKKKSKFLCDFCFVYIYICVCMFVCILYVLFGFELFISFYDDDVGFSLLLLAAVVIVGVFFYVVIAVVVTA